MLYNISREFNKRVCSSIILVSIFIIAIFYSPIFFNIVISVIAFFMLYEWYKINKNSNLDLLIGVLLISIAMICVYIIHLLLPNTLTMIYFMIIWATDTFAMLGGKIIGGPKLAHKISPGKTWSGLLCGVVGAIIVIILFDRYIGDIQKLINNYNIVIFTAIIAIVSQMSDLLVSIFKRKHNVKDSGKIIPGHGGMLDRFDSIILTSPLVLLILK